MTTLLDANVVFWLVVGDHVRRGAAEAWFAAATTFAACPSTCGRLLRLLILAGHSVYTARAVLEAIKNSERLEFAAGLDPLPRRAAGRDPRRSPVDRRLPGSARPRAVWPALHLRRRPLQGSHRHRGPAAGDFGAVVALSPSRTGRPVPTWRAPWRSWTGSGPFALCLGFREVDYGYGYRPPRRLLTLRGLGPGQPAHDGQAVGGAGPVRRHPGRGRWRGSRSGGPS